MSLTAAVVGVVTVLILMSLPAVIRAVRLAVAYRRQRTNAWLSLVDANTAQPHREDDGHVGR